MATPEIDVSGCEVFKALMIAMVIVVLEEALDAGGKFTRQEVILLQDAVHQGLMPSLNLALGLRMAWCAKNMIHAFAVQPTGQLASDVVCTVVGQHAWFVADSNLITA